MYFRPSFGVLALQILFGAACGSGELDLKPTGDPVRINDVENNVLLPGPLNDYVTAWKDDALFICWPSVEEKRIALQFAEIDGKTGRVVSSGGLVEADGDVLSPTIIVHGESVEIGWLVRQKVAGSSKYSLHLGTLQADSGGRRNAAQSFEFGRQLRPFSLVSWAGGLAAVASVRSPESNQDEIRMWAKRSEDRVWRDVLEAESERFFGKSPQLLQIDQGAILFWESGSETLVAVSRDGETWRQLQSRFPGKNSVAIGDQKGQIWLVYCAEKQGKTRLSVTRSDDSGQTWQSVGEELELEGVLVRWSSATIKNDMLLLACQYSMLAKDCETVEALKFSGEWTRYLLAGREGQLCLKSLNLETSIWNNTVVAVWSEKNGRDSTTLWNSSGFPWDRWGEEKRVLPLAFSGKEVTAVKITGPSENMLFGTFFAYEKERGPFQRFVVHGDLVLQRIESR